MASSTNPSESSASPARSTERHSWSDLFAPYLAGRAGDDAAPGWCPLHQCGDDLRAPRRLSRPAAVFDFSKGVWRCSKDCHRRPGVGSLANLREFLVNRGALVRGGHRAG